MKDALLKRISGRAGHKGVMLLLYLVFFAVHIAVSAMTRLPLFSQEEFSCVAVAKLLTGTDWTGAFVGGMSGYSSIISALLYVPAVFVSSQAEIQYGLILGINGALMSFIPVLAYSCCIMLGMEKRWQAAFCSACAGGFTAYMLYSKFSDGESMAMLLPWLALFLLLKADKTENRNKKMLLSFFLALTAAASLCADHRLIALILAVITAVLISRFVFGRKTVHLPIFFISLAGLTAAAVLCNCLVQQEIWGVSDPTLLNNTVERFISQIPLAFSKGAGAVFACFSSQLYGFVCGSCGVGALGIALTVILAFRYFTSKKEERKRLSSPRSVFLSFTAALSIFMLSVSVLSALEGDLTAQSGFLSCRFMDGIMPFTLLFVLVFVFKGELALTEISGGIITAAMAYLLFFITGRGAVLDSSAGAAEEMYALIPIMFGEGLTGKITSTGLLSAVSCSLCLMAILLVIVSCAKKLKKPVVAAAVAIFTLYSLGFGIFFCLPQTVLEDVQSYESYERLSDNLFNNKDAPDVTVYRCAEDGVMTLQYLNQNITVSYADDPSRIQENTYIIVTIGTDFGIDPKELLLVRQVDNYRIYAYGERAQAYKQAQTG